MDDITHEMQEIELDTPIAGVRFDTGNDWMDFGFLVVIIFIFFGLLILYNKVTKASP